jgi:hypothetical protein
MTVKLDLVGLDGNAFSLMGAFRKAARQQGWNNEEIVAVTNECMSGDYDHLLRTLMEHCESPDDEDDIALEAADAYLDDACNYAEEISYAPQRGDDEAL